MHTYKAGNNTDTSTLTNRNTRLRDVMAAFS